MKSRTMAFAATAKQLHYTNFTTIASGELTEFIEDYTILTITELLAPLGPYRRPVPRDLGGS